MNNIKVWPHLTLIALACALAGGIAAAVWVRREPTTHAATLPHAARVERVDGTVGLSRSLDNNNFDDRWVEVTPNTPVSVGDRIYARENSQASVAFTGRNFARLEPGSALDVIDLADGRTQLALRDGSAIFNVGELDEDDLFEVATPHGAFDLEEPGLYEVGLNDDGSAWVSVLSGLAQVVGLAGSGQIGKGEMLTLLGQTAADVALSRLNPSYAGGLVDDYYAYQYPDIYDGRYRDYNAYLNDPYYYDPYNRYASYRYVSDHVPGVWELDRYGDWQEVGGYGHAWRPRVEQGWAPYREGYWMLDEPYGLTWVSNEPWGYAPYHYGRWVNSGGQWYWVPEGTDARPAYAPALVAFLPATEQNVVGWVPLAPGESYAPVYYDQQWQPHYVGDAPVINQIVNLAVPGALTAVPLESFDRVIDRRALAGTDPRLFEHARPAHDPLSVALLRQAALRTANTRRRVEMPPGLAKRLDETRVYTSARPFAPPFVEDPSKALRVEAVPDERKRQRLQFRDERQAQRDDAGAPGNVEGRGRPKDERAPQTVTPDAARVGGDDREARRREQELRRQERAAQRELRQQSSPRRDEGAARAADERAEQRAQGQRVADTRRAEREAARGQQRQAVTAQREQQRAAMRQQIEARRNAERQAAAQQQRPRAQSQPVFREHRQPPGQARRQEAPASQRVERRQEQPQAARPQERQPEQRGPGGGGNGGGRGNGGGNGKGKGKP